jgi:hypothetical protein
MNESAKLMSSGIVQHTSVYGRDEGVVYSQVAWGYIRLCYRFVKGLGSTTDSE